MADLVTSQMLHSGTQKYSASFTSISDGTGESNVKKIDISELEGAPSSVKILDIHHSVLGLAVVVSFDHDVNDTVAILTGKGHTHGTPKIPDPQSAGGTGDVLFSTLNHSANDTYWIIIDLELVP